MAVRVDVQAITPPELKSKYHRMIGQSPCVKALVQEQTEALKTPADNGRRLRLYCLSLDQLHEALMGMLTLTGVPEDAQLIDVHYDFFSESIVLKYSHPSFAVIDCGFKLAFFDPYITSNEQQADIMNAEFLQSLGRKIDAQLGNKVESKDAQPRT